MNELKPCPFCGNGHPILLINMYEGVRIKCPNCEIQFTRDFYHHRGELGKLRTIEAWNRRADECEDAKEEGEAGST